MALSINLNISERSLQNAGVSLRNVIQRIIAIFIKKVGEAMMLAMAKVMPYNPRPSRRGKPPYSKSGRLVRSFRAVNAPKSATIYGESYGRTLRTKLDRDYVTAAWRLVKPNLQKLLNEAIREAQGPL